jgi:hypothetical protein
LNTGAALTTHANNVIIGKNAGMSLIESHNVIIGANSLFSATSARTNVAIGRNSGFSLTTGDSNIFIGDNAGYRQTTNSNLFIVDNRERANAATELSHSIVYGVMGANPEDQSLRFNADTFSFGTDADSDVALNFLANTNSGVLTWMEDEDLFDFADTVKLSGGIQSSDGSAGATGSFTDNDGNTVTVKNGLITDFGT